MKTQLVHLLLIPMVVTAGAGGLRLPAGAQPSAPPVETVAPEPPSAPVAVGRISAAANEFGFRLLRKLAESEPGSNIFISPTSVEMALTMAWNGARGETRTSMSKVLGLVGLESGPVGQANLALLEMLDRADANEPAPDLAVALDIANALWTRRGVPLAESYIEQNRRFYRAEVAELDFDDPAAPGIINRWVADRTHERVREVVSRLTREDVLVLVNAVYFKGKWQDEFDPELTREQDFHLSGGTKRAHPMMRRTGEFSYSEAEDAQLVELPYGDGRFSMFVLLPGEGVRLGALVAAMTPERWASRVSALREQEGNVVLPKFRLEYQKTLNQTLASLGMAWAFEPSRADFNGMLPAEIDMPFYISQVLHKTFVEVTEEGTEAAAVTGVKMALTAFDPERKKFSMVCDRPFFFAIRDHETGAILFIGVVHDPRL